MLKGYASAWKYRSIMGGMGTHRAGEITLLLEQMGCGDTQASEKLLRLVNEKVSRAKVSPRA